MDSETRVRDRTCGWYDIDYLKFGMMSLSDILGRLKTCVARNIIITGGEPIIQPHLDTLLNALKAESYFLCIKTDELEPAPPRINYVATSPKAYYATRYETSCIAKTGGVRIVVDGDIVTFYENMERKIRAYHYYLLPYGQSSVTNIYDTIRQTGLLNSRPGAPVYWQLGVQTHKWVGIK